MYAEVRGKDFQISKNAFLLWGQLLDQFLNLRTKLNHNLATIKTLGEAILLDP